MQDLSPRPADLEPIETASVDELRGLQAERLRWSVRHAYDHVAHYRAAGADVVLIGEALVTGDPVATLGAFLDAGASDALSDRRESK